MKESKLHNSQFLVRYSIFNILKALCLFKNRPPWDTSALVDIIMPILLNVTNILAKIASLADMIVANPSRR